MVLGMHNMTMYEIDQHIVLRIVHPLFEPCAGQILALCYSSPASHMDGIHLVISTGKKTNMLPSFYYLKQTKSKCCQV